MTDRLVWQRVWLGTVAVAVLVVVAVLGRYLDEPWAPLGPVINEVVTSNASTLADEDGDFPDWIELHNPTGEALSLAGFHLSDDPDDPARWPLPDVLLEPDGYLVVFASGKDRRDPDGELHTDFRLGRDGDPLLLTGAELGAADRFDPVAIPRDASFGRDPERPSRTCFFAFPTPGETNADECFDDDSLGIPTLSATSGFYDGPVTVEVDAADDAATIVYTLDGSYPDPEGNPDATRVYEGPLRFEDRSDDPDVFASIPTAFAFDGSIHGDGWRPPDGPVPKATVLRARTLFGREAVATYFVGDHLRRDAFPVVSIAADGDHLFDDEVGIYVPGQDYADYVASDDHDPDHGWNVPANPRNRGREWERPPVDDLRRAVHLTWCEPGGACTYSRDVGIRIHGGYTRILPQKSLRLYARNDYGDRTFRYPFFGDAAPDAHRRLLLRNGGNTWGLSLFADGLLQGLVSHLDLETQAFRPTVVHLNGEYWGIHNLRERYDQHYLEATHGVDPARVALLGSRVTVEAGGDEAATHFLDTLALLDTGGAVDDATVAEVGGRVDLQNLMDYLILEVFTSNADWPDNNVRLWRSLDADGEDGSPTDGRWRWMVFDLDMVGGSSYDHQVDHDNLARLELDPDDPTAGSGLPWLLHRLLTNDGFRDAFVNRFADHLNATFAAERTVAELDAMEELFATEMPQHVARWGYPGSVDAWRDQVDLLRTYLVGRPDAQRRQLIDHLDLGETVQLRVVGSDPDAGEVRVNSLALASTTPGVADPADWTGTYFADVPVTLEAAPAEGHRFVGWEGVPERLADQQRIELTLDGDTTVRAVFAEG